MVFNNNQGILRMHIRMSFLNNVPCRNLHTLYSFASPEHHHTKNRTQLIYYVCNVAASWTDYILQSSFTIYALPLTEALPSAFGSDSHLRVPALFRNV